MAMKLYFRDIEGYKDLTKSAAFDLELLPTALQGEMTGFYGSTYAGSGFSGTIETLQKMMPDAEIIGEGSDGGSSGMMTGVYPDGSTPTYSGEKLKLTVDGEEIIIAMYDNTAVDALLERLPLENISFLIYRG